MKALLVLILGGLLVACPARAQEAKESIPTLIAQLGSGDFKKREEASRKLKALGKEALPALKEALTSDDPEIASRAGAIIKRIETPGLPGGPVVADIRAMRVRTSMVNGRRVLEVAEQNREFRIEVGPDESISMSVTGLLDGQQVTQEITAATPDQLKNENPEAYKLFERWMGNGPGFVIRGPMVIGPGIAPAQIMPARVVPDELDLLRAKIDKQMRDNNAKQADRETVEKALDELAQSRADGDMESYSAKADEVRKVLEGQKLDPGQLLPPPANARLGVSVSDAGNGLVVGRIAEKSRAEKIGLKSGDVIVKVDGKEVASVSELRKAVSENVKNLTVEITRAGEGVTLKEKDE